MKRYKKRARVLTLILCFVLIMTAGSAYAFMSRVPLTIVGRTEIDFRMPRALQIELASVERIDSDGFAEALAWLAALADDDSVSGNMGYEDFENVISWEASGSTGDVNLHFQLNGQRRVVFNVRNTSYSPILITDAFTRQDGLSEECLWGFEVSTHLTASMLYPEEVAQLVLEVRFNPDFELWTHDMIYGGDAVGVHVTTLNYQKLF